MSQVAGVRDALLIATGEYQNKRLRRLRSPAQDARELAAVLEDPDVGGFQVSSVIDKPHYDIAQSIERFFQDRSPYDLLLVHLSCHGIKDDDGLLYFAASNTSPDLPASTSVSAEFLRNQMLRCRAKSIVLLLDCCYSGSFLAGMKGDENIDLREELAGHGRVVITATSRTEYAWEDDGLVELKPAPSRFTGAVVAGLRTGEADLDGDGRIGVDELYDYVYDALRRAKVRQTPRKWADLEYRVFVATAKRSTRQTAPNGPAVTGRTRRGRSATIRIGLSLAEAAFGACRELSIDTFVRCSECGGTGSVLREMPTNCEPCNGSGLLQRDNPRESPCPACEGYGTVIPNPCPQCAGDGRVQTRRTLTVRIPPGVEDGTHIQYIGQCEAGPLGGPNGDLFLEVVELKHPDFERRGCDLYTSTVIPKAVAAAGGTIHIETLEGPRNVRIGAGLTSGTLLRIAGAGVPHLHDGSSGSRRGDLMVRVSLGD